jgi:hypothetical protein
MELTPLDKSIMSLSQAKLRLLRMNLPENNRLMQPMEIMTKGTSTHVSPLGHKSHLPLGLR